MTNHETGETKEVSMEEFLQIMNGGGEVSIRQEVRHADGTVTSSVIYGNEVGDGVDRSLSIFGEMNAVLMPAITSAKKRQEADENAEKIFYMDNADADYEVTIDDTKMPMIHIVTCTKEHVQVARYTRDERRTIGKPMHERTWEFEDGKFEASLEEMQEDNIMLFVFGIYEMRKILAERGILQEMKRLNNRSTGVLITIEEDELVTKIVRGMNRPELPCLMFGGLFAQSMEDAVMMRPYPDEMMMDTLRTGMSLEDKIKGAEDGDPDLMENLAQMYLNGDEVEQDFDKSAYWWEKLAESGSAVGQFNIGLHYAKGCGVKRDFEKAAKWMKISAENGDEEAVSAYEVYANINQNLKKAEAGDAAAQAEVARVFTQMGGSLEQYGPQNDYEESFKWAKKAAEQDNLDGIYCLALCYEHGRGTEMSKEKAAETYEKAAVKGHAPSQWNLAVCYLNGSGCEQDQVKGYMWAYQAADQNYHLAVDGLNFQYHSIKHILERYANADTDLRLEETQYEGRLERCEFVKKDDELTVKIGKDKNGNEALELFHKGGSVGIISRWDSAPLIALLKLDRITLSAKVKLCLPKSKRGNRAKTAEVHLLLLVQEINAKEVFEEKIEKVVKEIDEDYVPWVAGAIAEAIDETEIPCAEPAEKQHTHLDFLNTTRLGLSMFGGMIQMNQTGTEYSFQSVEEMMDHSSELSSIFERVVRADQEEFELAGTACDMAELFRVEVEHFDAGHDREQEIKNGYVHRAAMYNTFRSFAWTLAAYCKNHDMQPAEVSLEKLEEIVEYIEFRDGLNYTENTFAPVICSGDDLHNYYIPDSVSKADREKILRIVNKDVENDASMSDIASLDGLRRELAYMYPAIQTIYDALDETRDPDEVLEGGIADILYVWCAFTYAARQPIYSEDGPMNCWWEHPDEQVNWELKFKIDQLKYAIERGEEWKQKYDKDILKHPSISFGGKAFVFAGVTGRDEWLEVLEKLTEKGGIHRTAVSGKTDYLVCYPEYAGDSQVMKAKEQKIKGKNVKIILYEDLLKALKISVKTPREELDELEKATAKPKRAKKEKKPVVLSEKTMSRVTYEEKLSVRGNGYRMDIPDGFEILEGEENRDFIAYLPNKECPEEYLESEFIIYAGKKQANEAMNQFRLPLEYSAVVTGLSGAMRGLFASTRTEMVERPELPGAIVYGFDSNVLHANGFFGMDGCIQMMRVQISKVNTRTKAEHELLIKKLFERMYADHPVQILSSLTDEKYVNMSLDGKEFKEWKQLAEDYVSHILTGRNLQQQGLVTAFQNDQEAMRADVAKFKNDLKDMLQSICDHIEAELKKAEYLYLLKSAAYPGHKNLSEMKEAVKSFIDSTEQYVNLDGERISAEPSYANAVNARLKMKLLKAIDSFVEGLSESEKAQMEGPLKKARASYEVVAKKIEEQEAQRKKAAEEKKRLEAERREAERLEAEKRRKEEEKRREAERREAEKRRKEKERLRKEKEAAEKAKWKEMAAKKRWRYFAAAGMIASSYDHVVVVKPDGTVLATGKNSDGQCNVSNWRNVVSVVCDYNGTVGLTAQGTVLYTGSTYHRQNQCTSWRNIKQIAISNQCIFGLKQDGTVVATTEGNNGKNFSTQPDVTTWRDIVELRPGNGNILGIKADGSIVAIQRNYYGRCEEDYYVNGKKNAQDAAFGYLNCGVVLHKDGRCTSAGTQYSYCMKPTELNKHDGIVKIDMCSNQPVAILADGTIIAEPTERGKGVESFLKKHNITKAAAVCCRNAFTVLTEDGRVLVKLNSSSSELKEEECFGRDFRLFDDFNKMMDRREAEAERQRKEQEEQERLRKEEEKRRAERRAQGVCQYCGGTFKKGFLSTKCTACGKKKDY